MHGKVTIELVPKRGLQVVDRRETHNLVLTAGYDELIKVLGGDTPAQHYADRMQFGTGGVAPVAGDATLAMPITPIKTIANIAYPTGGDPFRVIFEAYLLAAEGNGFSIAEAGLLSPAGVLIARAVFTSVAKTSDYALHATWTISD